MSDLGGMHRDADSPHPSSVEDLVLKVSDLDKTFRSGTTELVVLANITFAVQRGEMVALVGESGSGKSTLLYLLSSLDAATSGKVICAGKDVTDMSDAESSDFRNRSIGFVWQFHHLLPEFTAAENVAMPLLTRGMRPAEALPEAMNWLREVGLEARAQHRSGELSGGEQQRVALARALVTRPAMLLADEPTGNLDARNGTAVFELMARLHREHSLTSLIATHNLDFARRCTRVLKLASGTLQEVAPEML